MWLLLALLPYHFAPSLQMSTKTYYSINSVLNLKKNYCFQPSTGQKHSLINL